MSAPLSDTVHFRCVSVRGKLRVRIVSPGYLPGANCQFPRAIRCEGGEYTAPASAVSTSQRGASGTYFYRVKASAVRVVDGLAVDLSGVRVFADESPECVVCMDAEKTEVFVPCGHFCCCKACVPGLRQKCPMCRAPIAAAVDRALIET